MAKKDKPIFVGIAGPSGSGKSSLCKMLKRDCNFEHIKLDNYFKNPSAFPKKHGFANWEITSNLKFDKLLNDLKVLARGEIVHTKDFPKKAGIKPKRIVLKPKRIILVEGFLLFKNKAIRNFFDRKVYLDIPSGLMLKRRAIRFGNNHISEYARKVAIPEYMRIGIGQKKYADIVFNTKKPLANIYKKIRLVLLNLMEEGELNSRT